MVGLIVSTSFAGKPHAVPSDSWVATDALGRTLPTYAETGDEKADKVVGIFYFVWHGFHTQKVYDVTEILKETDESKRQWGPELAQHYWAEPEYGYFHSSDPWVIRRDMQMLANAKVDFIYLDVTNGFIYENSVVQLLDVILEMRAEGINAPKVVFMTNAQTQSVASQVFNLFYEDPKYKEVWFQWEGRPLIFGLASEIESNPELLNYFTIKRSWAWTDPSLADHWQWLDEYPQDFGWSESPDVPEQLAVAVASHPFNSIGKSYSEGEQPEVFEDYTTLYTDQGLFFEEQWSRVHEVDPQVVLISGWNEWVAMRFIRENVLPSYAGRPEMKDQTWFGDSFSAEFNRDAAPMKGGYTDNYYYQMVGHIRQFKGLAPPPERSEKLSIDIDGEFEDWANVPVNYSDPIRDTMHRSYQGTDPETIYTNTYGRNDIVSARVVEGSEATYFMVTTADALTPHTDEGWMVLLIDSDQSKETGWEGYELAINYKAASESTSVCMEWGGDQWLAVGEVQIGYDGAHLELAVPAGFFSPRDSKEGFDFKWCDNVQLDSIESFFLEGDVAPDRRFNYRY